MTWITHWIPGTGKAQNVDKTAQKADKKAQAVQAKADKKAQAAQIKADKKAQKAADAIAESDIELPDWRPSTPLSRNSSLPVSSDGQPSASPTPRAPATPQRNAASPSRTASVEYSEVFFA